VTRISRAMVAGMTRRTEAAVVHRNLHGFARPEQRLQKAALLVRCQQWKPSWSSSAVSPIPCIQPPGLRPNQKPSVPRLRVVGCAVDRGVIVPQPPFRWTAQMEGASPRQLWNEPRPDRAQVEITKPASQVPLRRSRSPSFSSERIQSEGNASHVPGRRRRSRQQDLAFARRELWSEVAYHVRQFI